MSLLSPPAPKSILTGQFCQDIIFWLTDITFVSSMANVFIVAPESLSTLFEGTPSIRKDAQTYVFIDLLYAKVRLKLPHILYNEL